MCMFICIYVHMRMFLHVYFPYMHLCITYVCTHVDRHIRTHACMCMNMEMRVHIYIHTYIYIYMYTCIYIYTYRYVCVHVCM